MNKGWVQTTYLSILALLLSMILAEVFCRVVLPQPGFYTRGFGDLPGLWIAHGSRGFTHAPNFNGIMRTPVYSTTIRTNAKGLRDSPALLPQDNRPVHRILAVGDSFTFGLGVEAEESWPARLQDHLNADTRASERVAVTNAGIPGYSLSQIATLTKEMMSEQDTDMVILGLLPGALGRLEDPFVLFNRGRVRKSSLPNIKALGDSYLHSTMHEAWMKTIDFWLDEHFWIGAHIWKQVYRFFLAPRGATGRAQWAEDERRMQANIDRGLGLLLQELGGLAQYVRQRKKAFAVLLVINQEEDGTFNEPQRRYNAAVLAFCKEKNIPVLDLLPTFVQRSGGRSIFRIPHDGHWTVPAHDLVAKELALFIHQNQSVFALY